MSFNPPNKPYEVVLSAQFYRGKKKKDTKKAKSTKVRELIN